MWFLLVINNVRVENYESIDLINKELLSNHRGLLISLVTFSHMLDSSRESSMKLRYLL